MNFIAITIYGSHATKKMLNLIEMVLRAFVGDDWTKRLILVTTVGAANMIAIHNGVNF